MITNDQLQKTLNELDYLNKYYKEKLALPKEPYSSEYDARLRRETREVFRMIDTDVDAAAKPITVRKRFGRPLNDCILLTKLHLIQQLFQLTNRQMESFTDILILAKTEVFSYKRIERAYDDRLYA